MLLGALFLFRIFLKFTLAVLSLPAAHRLSLVAPVGGCCRGEPRGLSAAPSAAAGLRPSGLRPVGSGGVVPGL